jgi:prephenate dehydratase
MTYSPWFDLLSWPIKDRSNRKTRFVVLLEMATVRPEDKQGHDRDTSKE